MKVYLLALVLYEMYKLVAHYDLVYKYNLQSKIVHSSMGMDDIRLDLLY